VDKYQDEYDKKMALRYIAWKSNPNRSLWDLEYAWAKSKGFA
jgi:hypothetical protein